MTASDRLAPDTAMGAVTLLVHDLDSMARFYREGVGLDVLAATDDSITLGRAPHAVIVLEFAPHLSPAELGAAGLFHTAILFDTREQLATALYSTARYTAAGERRGAFTGSADHLVSLAFYFSDPEGNGVELYWDRERSAWSWTHGQLEMATLRLDPNEFLHEHLDAASLPEDGSGAAQTGAVSGGARVGHVHLSVGDTASAREFYVDRLGFETTVAMGTQALFVSAGGYHHHMAMNTWNSRGAAPRSRALGLGRVDILVPSADDLGAIGERMAHYGVEGRHDGRVLDFDDPWANRISVAVAAPDGAVA